MTGIVERWIGRGYGFIKPLIGRPGQVESVFVHITACEHQRALPAGAEVSFALCRGRDGRLQAANVKLRTLSAKVLLARAGRGKNV